MSVITSREIHLRSRPVGGAAPGNFELVTREVPLPAPGEVRVRNLWMSVDPYMGNRLYDRPNYIQPYRLGHVLDGAAVGIVLDSTVPEFGAGDLVFSYYGWREVCNAKAKNLTKLPATPLPPQAYLGIAGNTGMTAYVALFRIANLQPGETIYVSAAAGAVGSAACQMAKIHGCRVIGSAGGPQKQQFLREIGVDVAIDYRAEPDLAAALKRAAPEGINVYLDNVGGRQLEAAMSNMANFGRIAVCGMIGSYGDTPEPGPSNMFELVARRLRMEGFLLSDHDAAIRDVFREKIAEWIRAGRIRAAETVYHGIEQAPAAFLDMFAGMNIGKMLVKLT